MDLKPQPYLRYSRVRSPNLLTTTLRMIRVIALLPMLSLQFYVSVVLRRWRMVCHARFRSGLVPRALFLLVCLLGNDSLPKEAIAEDTQRIIVIRQRTRADYTASPQSLEQALKAPLTKTVRVASDDTLSRLISNMYGVGISNAPEAYKILVRHIVETNRLPDANQLPKGTTLVMPDLPPLAKTKPSLSNPFNAIAKLSITPRVADFSMAKKSAQAVKDRSSSAVNNVPVLLDERRTGAQEVVQLRLITLEEAKRLQSISPEFNEIDRAPLEIALEEADIGDSVEFPILSEAERVLLKEILSRPPVKAPLLIIVDDSWPDDDAFNEARDFLTSTIKDVRKKYRMGDTQFSNGLLTARHASYVHQPVPKESHAALIKRSILPFQALESPGKRVKVVFLPLLRSQEHAQELLSHLVAINLIAKHMGCRLGDDVPRDVRDMAMEQGKRYAALTASDISGKLLETDHAVLEAVLMFAYLYSEVTRQPFFMNMSWVVPNLQFQPHIPNVAYGQHIVAAGNEGDNLGTTVYHLKRQFACRSLVPGDMLAVMNVKSDGSPHCNSSLLSIDPDVLGFGFNGSLSGTPCGGTSFAAPRVAWLLAAREAYRPRVSENHTYQWIVDLRRELRAMRMARNEGLGQLQLEISKLFSGLSNP